jgi:hypothetical protein
MLLNYLKSIKPAIIEMFKATWIYTILKKLFGNPLIATLTVVCTLLAVNQGQIYYNAYMDMYRELNDPEKKAEEFEEPHLEFTKIDDNLYTLTGGVGSGDCERIVPEMPTNFTLILESPGGNLAEGSCLAAHIKLRNVVTVVRDTPVMNDVGKIIYEPGKISDEDYMTGKTVCASACGLMFLGGDKRYLIGDVWFGIHGPGTPPGIINNLNRRQLEASSFRTAANLLELLVDLGVEDPDLRLLFIKIPNTSMYWLKPQDFPIREGLIKIATNYRDFWGFTGSNPEGI